MNSKQLFYVLLALACLLVLVLFGSGYAANDLLSNKTSQLSKLKAQDQVLGDLQVSLIRNKSDIKRYSELNELAKAIVPQDKDQTQTVREIVKIASESGITRLSSVTFPASSLGATGGSNTALKTGGITQVTPVKGMSGVYTLPITVANSPTDAVAYDKFISFLAGLEQNRRTAQVTAITITPDPTNTNMVSFSLILNEYIKP